MNFFDDDPGLRHTVEFYLGPEQMELIGDELSEFGAIAAGELSDCVKRGDPRAAKLIHQSGLMALHSEPGNAVEHIALCFMIARTGDLDHLRHVALESGLARLMSVVDIEELRFEFMAGLLDRRAEARPRLGKTLFPFDFPLTPCEPLPIFTPGPTPESHGTLSGNPQSANRADANLVLLLAQGHEGETILCLARAEASELAGHSMVQLDQAAAWRIGSKRHALEFMIDFLRANDQGYALAHAAGLIRAHAQSPASLAWSDALLAGCVYLIYLDDMVELGHARQPEAVFRRVMLECADAFLLDALPAILESDAATEAQFALGTLRDMREIPARERAVQSARLANEMNEKNLWPLCLERFEKFIGELDEARMQSVRESLAGRLEALRKVIEEQPTTISAPIHAGGLFMALALASEANWSLKNRDYAGKMESVTRVIETLNL